MARIPDDVVDRIKREVSLVDLITAKGYELKKHGSKNVAICCPFHRDDKTPSLIITPEKNLFNCLACGAAGSPIDWQMKIERVSFRHAVEQLKALLPAESSVYEQSENVKTEFTSLAANLAAQGEYQKQLQHSNNFYHAKLKHDTEGLTYLEKRGLNNAELIETFKLGRADRTLAYQLPPKGTKDGDLIRGQLQELGLLRESGHEHFNGCITVPVMDENGVITGMYGRRIQKSKDKHFYLDGPHKGIWNPQCLKATDEVILCEALIDAMTFWVHGFRNVTASYGTGGFTADHLAAFKEHQIKRVYIAYDRDQAGDTAAETLAKKLVAEGFVCYRVLFPKGMDANEYALKVTPAVKSLDLVIRQAEWMGGNEPGNEPGSEIIVAAEIIEAAEGVQAEEDIIAVAAKEKEPISEKNSPEKNSSDPFPFLAAKTTSSSTTRSSLDAEITEHEIKITIGSRFYRIRGLQQNLSYNQLKVNIVVKNDEGLHVDTVDLGQSKQRAIFIKEAANELNAKVETIKQDVAQLFLKLEDLRDDLINATFEKKDAVPVMTDEERESALNFLRDPQLLDRLLEDFNQVGVVGEDTNKLVGYLACVSRKMKKPLAVMIQSSSAAGKTSLMDAVLNMMPEEERIQYSAMSGQSIYYMGEKNLKHKILAIAEEEGAENASYALKLLQSEGEVTMASTGKNAITGNLETQDYKVEGPVSLFYTTTALDIDEELKNRCIVLTVDESREQTAAIHARQRFEETLEGLVAADHCEEIVRVHRNAQRLLRPLKIVNPYANAMTFLNDKARTRRDHVKYLGLIKAVTLLHQYQREVQKVQNRAGEWIDYIEVTPTDIAIANKLANEVLGRSLDELTPQSRRLLDQLQDYVRAQMSDETLKQDEVRFSRKAIREKFGWGHTQCRLHLDRLVEMEYVLVHRGQRGQQFEYELLYCGEGQAGEAFVIGLIDAALLTKKHGTTQSWRGESEELAGSWRPQNGVKAAPKRGAQNEKYSIYAGSNHENGEDNGKTHSMEKNNGVSYRSSGNVNDNPATLFPAPKYLMADTDSEV